MKCLCTNFPDQTEAAEIRPSVQLMSSNWAISQKSVSVSFGKYFSLLINSSEPVNLFHIRLLSSLLKCRCWISRLGESYLCSSRGLNPLSQTLTLSPVLLYLPLFYLLSLWCPYFNSLFRRRAVKLRVHFQNWICGGAERWLISARIGAGCIRSERSSLAGFQPRRSSKWKVSPQTRILVNSDSRGDNSVALSSFFGYFRACCAEKWRSRCPSAEWGRALMEIEAKLPSAAGFEPRNPQVPSPVW